MNKQHAIVIGSGVAGMATAIRLAIKGFDVSVYEKNNYPGGKLTIVKNNDFTFDAGPSLFTEPENIEELFSLANEPIEQYFNYAQVDIACKYFFENGKIITAPNNALLLNEEVHNQLAETTNLVTNYLKKSAKIYNNIGSVFINKSLHKKSTWFNKKIFKAIRATKLSYLFKTLHQYNSTIFKSKEAIQIFDRYATFNGSNPYKAPAMLSLIPHIEYNKGVYFPQGGMISITNALYKLAFKKGVKFYFNTLVDKIIHHTGKAIGIVVNGKNIIADVIVSNMDVYFTYKCLLNDESTAKKLLKQQRSTSALVFYWGIKSTFSQLQLHNIFFSKNYEKEFDELFQQQILPTDPTVYINISSKIENDAAPKGKENWFVMINAPENIGQNWDAIILQARATIIEKLNRILSINNDGEINIESLIETENILNPILLEQQTAAFKGALYGASSNSKYAAFLRHPNFSKKIKNLYFCGGTVHPGGGIPLCLKSAKIVSDLIKSPKNIAH